MIDTDIELESEVLTPKKKEKNCYFSGDELDNKVKRFVSTNRKYGGVVNTAMEKAAALNIFYDRLLVEHVRLT